MAQSTGYILAAAGIVVANEMVFTPVATHQPIVWKNFNWRILPATAIAAVTLAGLEKLSPPLGEGLAVLALLVVLMKPLSQDPNAPTVIDNAYAFLTGAQNKTGIK